MSLVELTIAAGEGEGGGRGAKSDDREKAWPSVNHSILSNETLTDLPRFSYCGEDWDGAPQSPEENQGLGTHSAIKWD